MLQTSEHTPPAISYNCYFDAGHERRFNENIKKIAIFILIYVFLVSLYRINSIFAHETQIFAFAPVHPYPILRLSRFDKDRDTREEH
jgi:hypothetical protein